MSKLDPGISDQGGFSHNFGLADWTTVQFVPQSARTAFGVRRNGLTDSIFYKTKLDNLERMSELDKTEPRNLLAHVHGGQIRSQTQPHH